MGRPWVLQNVGGVIEYDLYVDWLDLDRLQYKFSGMHTRVNDLHRIVYCILDDIYELWNNDM
jgi:Txe/YoeB family toxin of Txe-Axe toxin-antitoxin module